MSPVSSASLTWPKTKANAAGPVLGSHVLSPHVSLPAKSPKGKNAFQSAGVSFSLRMVTCCLDSVYRGPQF